MARYKRDIKSFVILQNSNGDIMNEKLLLDSARKALKNSYSPYSKFRVGSSVLCSDGSIFSGANVENASFGLTVCAERAAVFSAVCMGKRKIKALAVVSDKNEPPIPCGACLQVLSEFSSNPDIYLYGKLKRKKFKLKSLLTKSFRLEK